MNNKTFKPTPTPIVMAMWEYLGRLTSPTKPTAGTKLHVLVWKAAIQALFPSMWARIEQSSEAVEFCRPFLAQHGVRLV